MENNNTTSGLLNFVIVLKISPAGVSSTAKSEKSAWESIVKAQLRFCSATNYRLLQK